MQFFPSWIARSAQQLAAATYSSIMLASSQIEKHPVINATPNSLFDLFQSTVDNYKAHKANLKIQMPKIFELFKSLKTYLKCQPNTLNRIQRTQTIIENIVVVSFSQLAQEKQNLVFGTLYNIVRPQTQDPKWAEHNFQKHMPQFLQALDLHGFLGREARHCDILVGDEQIQQFKSHTFTLGRQPLPRGEISYINGITTTPDAARGDAERISDNLASSHDISVVYNGSQDLVKTLAMQGGLATAPVKLILDQWMRFFSTRPSNENYLQICFSQGAVHVNNALNALEPALRKRICVIAIAPAIFIPPTEGCKVRHFFKANDPFAQYTHGRGRLFETPKPEDIIELPEDSAFPHDPHGPEFVKAMKPLVERYIKTNSIL